MKLKLPYTFILCALILWSCKTNISKKNETPKQPNIVLFFVDDLGWASYRVSSRMATDPSTSLEHLGFRTVATPEMVNVK